MAVDPDVQILLDGVNARLISLETTGGLVDFLNVLTATDDDEDLRLVGRLVAALPALGGYDDLYASYVGTL